MSGGYWKVQANTNRKQTQCIYHHSQLCHVTPGNALIVSVCIFTLPMLGLAAEHLQIATMLHMNFINQSHANPHQMTFSNKPLVVPTLNNILPPMVLQNRVLKLNVSCHPHAHHVSPSLGLSVPNGVLRRVVRVVVVLLLLLSGDIEINPGPLSEFFSAAALKTL